MTEALRILIVEDTEDDAELMMRCLRREGIEGTYERVESADAMRRALVDDPPDLVLSDWTLPQFSAPAALAVMLESELDVPFIIVSGTIDEEIAVYALKAGAHDFVLKGRMARLAPAVERELRDAATRRAERAARAARERTERLLALVSDSMPDGLVAISDGGEVLAWNPAASDLLGAPPEEADDVPDFGFILPDGSTPCPPKDGPLARALGGETVSAQELCVSVPSTGALALVSVDARPIRDGEGNAHGALAVLRDVTHERAAQRQLAMSDRMASMGLIAAGVAHEINSPLSSLVLNAQLARERVRELGIAGANGPELEEIERELADVQTAGHQILSVVRDVKVFCHDSEDATKPVEVSRAIESALRMASGQIEHRITVVTDLAPVPRVLAHESRLCQVFLNLVVNAAQAMEAAPSDGARISVTTAQSDRCVIVEIRDSGPGIPDDVMAKLFTPFFTTKPAGQGTGLGLSISKRIIESFGGEICVESPPEGGALFRVTLAACDADLPTRPLEPGPAALTDVRSATILAVDDDPLVTDALRRSLGRTHTFDSENDPRAALERIERGERFDLILCDLQMPQVSGLDFLARLEAIAPEQAQRLVFLSGSSRGELSRISRPHLEKPFDTEALRAFITSNVPAS